MSIEDKIRNAALALGTLAGDVRPDQWDLLACAKSELLDAADQVAIFEKTVTVEMLSSAAAHTGSEVSA